MFSGKKIISSALAACMLTSVIAPGSDKASAVWGLGYIQKAFSWAFGSSEELQNQEQQLIEELKRISGGQIVVEESFTQDLDPQVRVRILKKLSEIFKVLPNIFGNLFSDLKKENKKFTIGTFNPEEEEEGTIASTNKSRMRFNKERFSSLKRAESEERKEVASRAHAHVPEDQLIEVTVAHEAGHLILKEICSCVPEFRDVDMLMWSVYPDDNVSARNNTELYIKNKVLKLAKEKYGYKLYGGFVSSYGMKDYCEWFAEQNARFFCNKMFSGPLGFGQVDYAYRDLLFAIEDYLKNAGKPQPESKEGTAEAAEPKEKDTSASTEEKEKSHSAVSSSEIASEALFDRDKLCRLMANRSTAKKKVEAYVRMIESMSSLAEEGCTPSKGNFAENWFSYLSFTYEYCDRTRDFYDYVMKCMLEKGMISEPSGAAPEAEKCDEGKSEEEYELERKCALREMLKWKVIPDRELSNPMLKDEMISNRWKYLDCLQRISELRNSKRQLDESTALREDLSKIFDDVRDLIEKDDVKSALAKAKDYVATYNKYSELWDRIQKENVSNCIYEHAIIRIL